MAGQTTDFEEFQEQIRLQTSQSASKEVKTRVDPDGTVMEWDEKRKAWFPKIDDDFIAQYQMNFGVPSADVDPSRVPQNLPDWSNFTAQLAELRAQKGENSEEVQAMVKSAQDSLQAYYNSPAYREWYANYQLQEQQQKQQVDRLSAGDRNQGVSLKPNRGSGQPTAVRPSERVLRAFEEGGDAEDAESALVRAEEEQKAGIPIAVGPGDDTTSSTSEVNPTDSRSDDADAVAVSTTMTVPGKRKQSAPPPAWYEMDDSKNTHVYVSGLPPEITDDTFLQLMSKYGVIMNDPLTDRPRVKLYRDPDGVPKGDGRCCYVKVESVELAMKLLDGLVYSPGYTLSVERAKFQPKGEFDPKRRRRLTLKEKKRLKAQQENLFRWGVDTSKFVRGKKERVVILKNAFIETDFQRDVTLIPTVRERIRTQCAKCGTVKKVAVYDANPLGVVAVTFSSPEEADTALGFLDKALFSYPGPGGPRQLQAERWDGKTNYAQQEDEDEAKSRIRQWEAFLGGDDDEEEGARSDVALKEEVVPDYWETSPDAGEDEEAASPVAGQDTDEELEARGGASSGAETD